MELVAWQHLKGFILDRPFKLGTVIAGRYTILQVLGMGSYGITYVVHDEKQNKRLVLKQMKPSRKKLDRVQLSFAYERKILSLLDHPQIPKFNEDFMFLDHYFFTMDYVEGQTFEDLIFKESHIYHEAAAFQILRDVLKIVDYIHSCNIVHRDLRIPNIMVKDDVIHIIDFGLARFIGDQPQKDRNHHDRYDIEKKLKREIHYKSDFFALGHFLLFLLYSSYTPQTKKERSWEEELDISINAKRVIRKLLQVDEPYMNVHEVIIDVDAVIHELKST